MSFKVSPKHKTIINGGLVFQFHDGIRSKILPTLLELFFKHFIKMDMAEWMNSHILNRTLASRINKLRDTAIELGSKYTFSKAFFSSPKNFRVTLKNTNHPVILLLHMVKP